MFFVAKDIYFQSAYQAVPRLFSLLDRSPTSNTYGCFDRNYWHFRTTDFPNAAKQQGVKVLAQLWSIGHPENIYYKSDELIELIKASLMYTATIQKSDGSFDEWYYNERGWAGPTGYLIHSVCFAYQTIKKFLSEIEQKKILDVIKRSAVFLKNGWERDVLSNHIAIASLALYDAYEATGNLSFKVGSFELIEKISEQHNFEEGWSLEYDGPDVGYQSATVSFLARILQKEHHEKAFAICETSNKFLSKFILPNGGFINNVSCRQSANLFHFGIEYFAGIDKSNSFAQACRVGVQGGTAAAPADHDDYYLIYRMPEFLDAFIVAKDNANKSDTLAASTFEGEFFFEKAGIIFKSWKNFYVVMSILRGGPVTIWNRETNKVETENNGVALKCSDGSLITNLWVDKRNKVEILSCEKSSEWQVYSKLKRIKSPRFTPFSFIVFRIFSILFAWNAHLAYWLKAFIRSLLILSKKEMNLDYVRTIKFQDDKILICDQLDDVNKFIQKDFKLFWGGRFFSRYIPQTKYFVKEDSLTDYRLQIASSEFAKINNSNLLTETILCAES